MNGANVVRQSGLSAAEVEALIVDAATRMVERLTGGGFSSGHARRLSVSARDRALDVGAWSGLDDEAWSTAVAVLERAEGVGVPVFSVDGGPWSTEIVGHGATRGGRADHVGPTMLVRCATAGCDFSPGHAGRCEFFRARRWVLAERERRV